MLRTESTIFLPQSSAFSLQPCTLPNRTAPPLGVKGPRLGAAKRKGWEPGMLTRRDIFKQAGVAAALATAGPWWLVRRAHAARREKLIVWNQIAQAPQVDRLMKEQCY